METQQLIFLLFTIFLLNPGTGHRNSGGSSSSSSTGPAVSLDVMGSYNVSNAQQCERMCWYRSLCTAFSYYSGNNSTIEINCVLHSSPAAGGGSVTAEWAEGWTRQDVNPQLNPNHGCATRPCPADEVCVPQAGTDHTPSTSGLHTCLPASSLAGCQTPASVDNGKVNVTSGTTEGSAAHVVCDNGFVVSPRGTSTEIVCQANSSWTAFQGQCLQAEWTNVQTGEELVLDFPWTLTTGSEMCVKGQVGNQNRVFFNFVPIAYSFINLPLHLDFRLTYGEVICDTLIEGVMKGLHTVGTSQLTAGDNYTFSFSLQKKWLYVYELKGSQLNREYTIKVWQGPNEVGGCGDTGVDLSSVLQLWMGLDVILYYVNLVSQC